MFSPLRHTHTHFESLVSPLPPTFKVAPRSLGCPKPDYHYNPEFSNSIDFIMGKPRKISAVNRALNNCTPGVTQFTRDMGQTFFDRIMNVSVG